ncbi:MAG: hypothetical protein OEY51_00265 [Cyclobacteriaceae bacterium]|nr:hypothetical protein [Cyclobacteriaceae bacterium]
MAEKCNKKEDDLQQNQPAKGRKSLNQDSIFSRLPIRPHRGISWFQMSNLLFAIVGQAHHEQLPHPISF